ncbi:hypothetical protein AcV7_001504 [Taiwanofungus camphoratus]|nr:hypothetical protein AcV7_001504 [Antrodia cinnamomea]
MHASCSSFLQHRRHFPAAESERWLGVYPVLQDLRKLQAPPDHIDTPPNEIPPETGGTNAQLQFARTASLLPVVFFPRYLLISVVPSSHRATLLAGCVVLLSRRPDTSFNLHASG